MEFYLYRRNHSLALLTQLLPLRRVAVPWQGEYIDTGETLPCVSLHLPL